MLLQVIAGAWLSQDQAQALAQLAAQRRGNISVLAARRGAAIAELNVSFAVVSSRLCWMVKM